MALVPPGVFWFAALLMNRLELLSGLFEDQHELHMLVRVDPLCYLHGDLEDVLRYLSLHASCHKPLRTPSLCVLGTSSCKNQIQTIRIYVLGIVDGNLHVF